MTPEQIEVANAMRAPSEKIKPTEVCGARKAKRPDDGNPENYCTFPSGYGTSHSGFGFCKHHGGNTRAGSLGAAREWGRLLLKNTKFGGDLKEIPDVTAEEALLEEVRRSVAMVRWLEDRIGTFAPEELKGQPAGLGGLPTLVTETSRGAATSTDVAAWMLLYREERQHMVRVAKTAIDAGIAERMVRIAEDQGRTLAMAIKAVLDALGLTPDQARMVPNVVPGILRQVSLGQPMAIEGGAGQ